MISVRMLRRHDPDFHARRLAVGLFGNAREWPRRNRLPRTVGAKLGHLLVGIALGAVATAVILAALGGAP